MTTLPERQAPSGGSSANLADILERVLDKGVIIAGDIRIDLLDIELLTIKLRLIVASVERAEEMGIDWWRDDPSLSSQARKRELARRDGEEDGGRHLRDAEEEREQLGRENDRLRERIAELESAESASGREREPEPRREREPERPSGEESAEESADEDERPSGRKAAKPSGGKRSEPSTRERSGTSASRKRSRTTSAETDTEADADAPAARKQQGTSAQRRKRKETEGE